MTTISAPPHQPGDIAIPNNSPSPRGRRFVAACASLLINGLGHVLAGKWRRGLVWFAAQFVVVILALLNMAFPAFTRGLYILLPLDGLLTIATVIDACRTARRSTSPMMGSPVARYVLGAVLLVTAFVAPRFYDPILRPIVSRFAVQAFVFSSRAMLPTIHPGDRFLASRLAPFSRWSAVVFRSPEDGKTFYISRIAGLPGETIEVKDKAVFINGHSIPSPAGIHYVSDDPLNHQGVKGKPMKLGSDEYFVLSDNSPVAADSRYWKAAPGHQPGAVPAAYIYGPVTWIYWPLSRIKRLYQDVSLILPAP